METKQVRGARVLLPSEDDEAVTAWPHPNPLVAETISNTEFRSLDLSFHRWTNVTLSRVRFVDCRIMGLRISGSQLSEVLFEGCQLDYSEFADVRAKGSAAFVSCKMTEAAFRDSDFTGVVFADCLLRDAEFASVKMTNTDLRGSEISGLQGILSLKGAEISEQQLTALFGSLVSELRLKVSEL